MKLAMLFSSAIVLTTFSTGADAQDKPLERLDAVRWLVGNWKGEEETLEQDIEGFSRKGEQVTMHFEVKELLGGKLLEATGTLRKGDQSHALMHQIWGIQGENQRLQQWFFDDRGLTLNGDVVESSDEFVVLYRGTAIPREGPMKALADRLGLDEVPYSAEAAYRLRDQDTFTLEIRNIKVAGQPFPWPGANKVHVHHRVK